MLTNISVFVLILNYNGLKFNKPCIDSVLKQDAANVKILFLDNGSEDGSLEACKRDFGNLVTYIDNKKNLYFAAGNNVGIKYALDAKADYIFVLNNDTVCSTDCIQKLTDFMEANPKTGACQPLLVEMYNPNRIASAGCIVSLTGRAWDAKMGEQASMLPLSPIKTFGVTGGAMFLRADALRQVGMFDESYQMYFEDVELSFRLTLAGYDLHVVPNTRVRHVVAGSSSKISTQRIYFCERNAYRLVGIYFPKKLRLLSLLTNLLFLAPAAILLNVLRKRPDCSLAVFKAMKEGCKQLTSLPPHMSPQAEALIASAIETQTIVPPIRKSR